MGKATPKDQKMGAQRKPTRPLTRTITVKKTGKVKSIPAPKIRSSLTPGTVCILLAGPYKGKRVVMLKALESGNLVVTGPYSVNGFPLRRTNPRFVAATSTKISVDGLDVAKFDDAYFNKTTTRTPKKEKETLFAEQGMNKKKELPAQKKADQDVVDSFLQKSIECEPLLKQYLKTRFTLRDRMYPHALKF